MSRVDVFIPCYKYGHYLRGCAQSVLSQEGVDVRVLILDDASPDNTEEVAKQLAEEDDRVTYRKHPVNRGHIATYNEGLQWARGDYLLLLSADDLLVPGALHRAVSLMDRHPDVGLTHGRVIRTERPGEVPSSGGRDGGWKVVSGWEYICSICQTGENVVATPTAVVRTSAQHKVGGYRKELPHAGDMEMWLRLAAVSAVGYVDADQAYYRMHGQNMSEGYPALRDLRQRREVFRMFFDGWGGLVPDAARLWATALQNLSREAFWEASKMFDAQQPGLCQELLELSADLDPSIRSTKEWKRLGMKRLVGARVWKRLKPLLGLFRRARPAGATSGA
jgi:glycosyltransferase involved in cell wall biosynthesis